MGADLLVLAPLSVEALALRRGHGLRVVRSGMGAERSARTARKLAAEPARTIVVAGLGGALDAHLAPGDVVVADEVRAVDGFTVASCADPESLAAALSRQGLNVSVGRIVSADHIVRGDERRTLARTGAVAVDMESSWLAPLARGRRFSVVRVVVDTPSHELFRPFHTLPGAIVALRSLARVGRALALMSAGAEAPAIDHAVP